MLFTTNNKTARNSPFLLNSVSRCFPNRLDLRPPRRQWREIPRLRPQRPQDGRRPLLPHVWTNAGHLASRWVRQSDEGLSGVHRLFQRQQGQYVDPFRQFHLSLETH